MRLESDHTVLTAVLGFCGMVVTGAVTFFGGRGSAAAQIQASLNSSFQLLAQELKEERDNCEKRCTQLEGEMREARQLINSLESALIRAGIPLPRPTIPPDEIIEIRGVKRQ